MIKCEKCGNTVMENERFCSECGASLVDVDLAYVNGSESDSPSGLPDSEQKDFGTKKLHEERFVPNTGIDITRPPVSGSSYECASAESKKDFPWVVVLGIGLVLFVVGFIIGNNYEPYNGNKVYDEAVQHLKEHDFSMEVAKLMWDKIEISAYDSNYVQYIETRIDDKGRYDQFHVAVPFTFHDREDDSYGNHMILWVWCRRYENGEVEFEMCYADFMELFMEGYLSGDDSGDAWY